jgi:hypothetical protein
MAKRKSAYRDYPPIYNSPNPPYGSYPGYTPYHVANQAAWKAYTSPVTQNYTILALDKGTNQWRLITHYALGQGRQDAVNAYYQGKVVPTQVIVFPSESGRKMKQPTPTPRWEELPLG